MTFSPTPPEKRRPLNPLKMLLSALWPMGKNHIKILFMVAALFLVLSRLANLYPPLLFKEIVDNLSISQTSQLLLITPVAMIMGYAFTRFLSQLFSGLKDSLFSPVTQNAMHRIAYDVFCKLHRLSLQFHLDHKMGGTGRALERGVKGIDTFLRFAVFMVIPAFLELTLSCVLLGWLYGPGLALFVAVILLAYIAFTLIYTQWRLRIVRQMAEVDTASNAQVVESLLQYETVKYFNNEPFEAARYDRLLGNYEKTAVITQFTLSLLDIVQGLIIAVGLSGALWLTSEKMTSHALTVGDFVFVNTLLIQLFIPLWSLGFAYREVKLALISMEEMFALLDVNEEIQDLPDAKRLTCGVSDITFKDVSFSYTPERPILKNVSFHVPAGKTVAIVGPSGAGKSTILRLLFRFYDATSGDILIGDQKITDVTQESLRAAIAVVPQETILFNESIGFNIGYGKPGATQEDIEDAAQKAKIHDLIMTFPEKYETLVGERGLKLSGGEKQRVAIARALLKAPKIFFFDEATSSLDTQTEKEIQKSLNEVSRKTTTLIVAHRLSTIVHADEILVLEAGTIVERGTHETLLTQGGLYATLWRKQQQDLVRGLEQGLA